MQLAEEVGRTFIREEIGLGSTGFGEVDMLQSCEPLMLKIYGLLLAVVQERFSIGYSAELKAEVKTTTTTFFPRNSNLRRMSLTLVCLPWKLQIQRYHEHRCFLTNLKLTSEFDPESDSEDDMPPPNFDSRYRILPLAPFLSDPLMRAEFWSFAASITGHSEWKAMYGDAIGPTQYPSHFLLLQKSVASEFSRFKFALDPPHETEAEQCKILRNRVDTLDPCPPDLAATFNTIDSHTSHDPILESIPNVVSKVKWDKCDQDLLNLHLFIFRLLDQTTQGHEWVSSEEWNEEDYEADPLYETSEEEELRWQQYSANYEIFLAAQCRDQKAFNAEQRMCHGLKEKDPSETELQYLQRILAGTPSGDEEMIYRRTIMVAIQLKLEEFRVNMAKIGTGI